MDETTKKQPEANQAPAPEEKESSGKKLHRHLIKPKWLRVTLKSLLWLLLIVIILPILVYIPPVQTFLKNVACEYVEKSTGMKVGIEKFRLKFPLDVSLQGVTVIEASGDTMVYAKEAIADVKLLPLLDLDIKINKLQLMDGYYRMLSPDSSMLMKIKAGFLEVDNKSSMSISQSKLSLNDAKLKDADVSLYMNVWKQQQTPNDTAASPFYISAHRLTAENLRFGMSMLPTIDTLSLATKKLILNNGVINLGENKINISSVTLDGGNATYLTPTPEYIASHPAPVDTTTNEPSEPFKITGDTLRLLNFKGLYAVKGATPQPGFDPNYIEATDINIEMLGFYNEASDIRLPFTRLQATERSGLAVTSGRGTINVNAAGLALHDFDVNTLHSNLQVDADLPFDALAMKPDADMSVKAKGEIGLADIEAFMPDLKRYTKNIPAGRKLDLTADAGGSISNLNIRKLHLNMPQVLGLDAKGYARNLMDMKKLVADLDFSGYLANPKVVQRIAGITEMSIPSFDIDGHVKAQNESYFADIDLHSSAGNLVGTGKVNLNSESYNIDADLRGLNVAQVMPELEVGHITASIKASGAGFNPTKNGAHTDANIFVSRAEYKNVAYKDIELKAKLDKGDFDVFLESPNKYLDLTLNGSGSIHNGEYVFDVAADIYNLDLMGMHLSETPFGGHGGIVAKGTANPEKWLYDIDLQLEDIDWKLDEETEYHFPYGASARLLATADNVNCEVASDQLNLDFRSTENLKSIVDKFTALMPELSKQIDERNVDVNALHAALPQFNLRLDAEGSGILQYFLEPTGMDLNAVTATLNNDSTITGNVAVSGFTNGSMQIDSLGLILAQRGSLLDYKARMINKPGTLDEFADVSLNGYVGQNRFSASLNQKNLKGETGYRLGLTGAFQDSVISLHFTPLKATIAYLPWTFNNDNYIDLGPGKRIDASLTAQSKESSILMETVPDSAGGTALHAKLDNIKIQDFLQMIATAPPVKGTINSDLNLVYRDSVMGGKGNLSVAGLTYDRTSIGNLDFQFAGGTNFGDKTGGMIALMIDGKRALSIRGRSLTATDTEKEPMQLSLTLDHFPLKIANAFLGKDVAQLEGSLVGKMDMTGSLTKPMLNGNIGCDSVAVFVPMIGSKLSMDKDSISVADNILSFRSFTIWGQNKNPLDLTGTVDFRKFTNLVFDLALKGENVQLINNDRRAKSDVYGKLFTTLNATVKGPQNFMDINADLTILNSTDITYALPTDPTMLTQTTSSEGIVKFVNFNDTTQVAKADTVGQSSMNMSIGANLTINTGTRATVILSPNGTDRVELTPSGTLHYTQNYMGDMRLNGQLNIGDGFARYNIPVIGDKKFTFKPNSYVLWGGDLMNPTLNIQADDMVKAAVSSGGGNSRMVNFDVGVSITNTLSAPKVLFDLSTNEDISVQNELASMSPDQKSSTAMNLLITGQYTAQGFSGGGADFNINNQLYGFLTSKLNSWLANNVRGVDLSFGIDQNDQSINGKNSSSMSYSYQMSKSLFNNKFKIVVGGNYSTDASADENFSQNLINDIAFEYMLRQTNSLSMYLKLFRHTGFESILEGEITETGVGLTMRRRLNNLNALFDFLRKPKRTTTPVTNSEIIPVDSITTDTINEK